MASVLVHYLRSLFILWLIKTFHLMNKLSYLNENDMNLHPNTSFNALVDEYVIHNTDYFFDVIFDSMPQKFSFLGIVTHKQNTGQHRGHRAMNGNKW